MKALLLLLVASAGHAAFAPNTTWLGDLEQNLSPTAGSTNGAETAAMVYQSTGAWHGSYAGGGGGSFTLNPTGIVGASGTLEFSFRTAAVPTASRSIYTISTGSVPRALEIYYFGNNFYAYSGTPAVNSAFTGGTVAGNTNYYIKDTWNGTSRIIFYGVWVTPGTVTLTQAISVASADLSSPTQIYLCDGQATLPTDGFMDWIRFRDVYDPTTTVTTDPASVPQLSPYMKQGTRNFVTPLLFLFNLFFTSPAYALESHTGLVGAMNSSSLKRTETKLKAAETAKLLQSGKITRTPTPTRTPNRTPTRTPTPGPIQEAALKDKEK